MRHTPGASLQGFMGCGSPPLCIRRKILGARGPLTRAAYAASLRELRTLCCLRVSYAPCSRAMHTRAACAIANALPMAVGAPSPRTLLVLGTVYRCVVEARAVGAPPHTGLSR